MENTSQDPAQPDTPNISKIDLFSPPPKPTGPKFRKYAPIELSSQQKELDKLHSENKTGGEWVVLEKVHGANFCFCSDGNTVVPSRRNGPLSLEDKFFPGWQDLFRKYENKVNQIYHKLNDHLPDSEKSRCVWLYGEFFGGSYPSKDVPKVSGIKHVQTGVFYAPYFEYYVFDIHNGRQYLDYDECVKLFEEFGFFYAKPLFRGDLQACLKYNHEFQTTIPQLLSGGKWPEIPNNTAEGIIIRPVKTQYYSNGSRVILKKKTDSFTEVYATKKKPVLTNSEQNQLSYAVKELLEEVGLYVNSNRLESVISKFGEISKKDKGKVTGMLAKDVWEDFDKDEILSSKFVKLSNREKKIVSRKIASLSGAVVDRYIEQEGIS